MVPEPNATRTVLAGPAWRRIAWRFAAAYLVFYNLPFPLDVIPGLWKLSALYERLWAAVTMWVASHVFGTTITVRPNGSGDTTYNYVELCCFFAVAVLTTLLWTILDRGRSDDSRVQAGVRIFVRFALARQLIVYGAIKVIKSQFPDPGLDRLLQPFGDASPMGLLWTFMGASTAYNVFAGGAELLGGLLLTMRRTTLLGALVAIGTLANVVMLNFCYDVPVKLFSLHLFAMALFLMAPDAARLCNLFLRGRGVDPRLEPPLFARPEFNRRARVVRTVAVAGYTALMLASAQSGRHRYGDLAPKSPLYGVWAVDDFVLNGARHPPLATDAARWQRVIFDYPEMMAIQDMAGSRCRYVLKLDGGAKTLHLTKRDEPGWHANLAYSRPDSTTLNLHGTADQDSLRVTLHRADVSQSLLLNRGFHWINEYPFNR
jgi:hypothetical protein